jgi:DNA-directed RNA polymerase subunit RPC12/RpoP
MKRSSLFKVIYFILAGLIGLLMLGFLGFGIAGKSIDPDFPTFMTFYFAIGALLAAAIISAISVFVYKDASKRGMDPWMWMTIAVFVPNLIGLIIYIIVRKNTNSYEYRCINCNKPVSSEFNVCPYCGSALNVRCPECGRKVSSEWTLCPYCSKKLK